MDINTILLIFFAIPFAIVLFSIALQKLIRNPFLVAGIIFSILLIIVLAFFDSIYLILVILYMILSFLTSVLTEWIARLFRRCCNSNSNSSTELDLVGKEELIPVSKTDSNLMQNRYCRRRY